MMNQFLNRMRGQKEEEDPKNESIDEDLDYVPESMRAAFEEANRALEQHQADFLAQDTPRASNNTTTMDDPFSPIMSPPPVNPAYGITTPDSDISRAVQAANRALSEATTGPPKSTGRGSLFGKPWSTSKAPETPSTDLLGLGSPLPPMSTPASEDPFAGLFASQPQETPNAACLAAPTPHRESKATKQDPFDAFDTIPPERKLSPPAPERVMPERKTKTPPPPVATPERSVSKQVSPIPTKPSPARSTASQQSPVIDNRQPVSIPKQMSPVPPKPSPPQTPVDTRPATSVPKQASPVPLKQEKSPSPRTVPTQSPVEQRQAVSTPKQASPIPPKQIQKVEESATPSILKEQYRSKSEPKALKAPPPPRASAPKTISGKPKTSSRVSPLFKQLIDAEIDKELSKSSSEDRRDEHVQGRRAQSPAVQNKAVQLQPRLVPSPSPPPPPPQLEETSALKAHRPKPINTSSHLLQPTTASKAKFTPEVKEPEEPSPTVAPAQVKAIDASHSHFLQPTSASQAKSPTAETKPRASPKDRPVNKDLVNRLTQPTSAYKAKISPDKQKESKPLSKISIPPPPSRLLQATAASKSRSPSRKANVSRPSSTTSSSSDRLLQPTASSDAAVAEGRARAQQRVRERMVQARKVEMRRASKALDSPENKFSAEIATEKAYERLRKKKKEQLVTLAQSSELFGQKLRRNTPPPPGMRKRSGLTVPEGPKFATDSRLGPKQILRQKKEDAVAKPITNEPRRLTVPKGPSFVTDKKLGERHPTPQRRDFTLAQSNDILAHGLRESTPVSSTRRKLTVTVPQSPRFHSTAKREKPKSTEERELEAIEEAKAKPFKARPIPRYGHGAPISVPRTAPRKQTAPKPFQLRSEIRAAHHKPPEPSPNKEEEDLEETKHQFKARPMPRFARSSIGVSSSKPRQLSLTTPKPFQLSGSRRTIIHKDNEEAIHQFKARPIPKSTYRPSIATDDISPGTAKALRDEERHDQLNERERQLDSGRNAYETPQAKPFTLRSTLRHEAYVKKLEDERRQRDEEETKMKVFHARPIRATQAPPTRSSPRTTTAPKPFVLSSEARHAAYAAEQKRKQEEEERELRRQSIFKAKPVPKTTYKAQKIEPKTPPPLVDPFSPEFQMKQRVKERKAFDEQSARQRAEDEAMKLEREAQARAEEEAELRERRQLPVSEGGMIPTAGPIGYQF